MKKILLALTAILFASLSNAQTTKSSIVKNVSSEEFKAGIEKDKNAILIDLRTTDEINRGFIKGSVQLDFLAKDAEKQIDKLDKNKTYYVYCAAGGRSSDAADYMEKHGFKKVINLEKGFGDWAKKGFAIEKK
jgi:rhodanese-related sulfurtransferase